MMEAQHVTHPTGQPAVGVVVGIGSGTGSTPVGPAPGDRHLWLELGPTRVRALLAVAAPYQPAVGDRVVVVGDGDNRFVIGVVERKSPPQLTTQDGSTASISEDGCLEVRDPEGQLRVRYDGEQTTIVAAAGDLVLDAPEGGVIMRAKTDVAVEAPRITLQAEQLFEKTRESVREVSSLLLTRAGRIRSLVRESFTMKSHRTRMVSEKETAIDGKRILLG